MEAVTFGPRGGNRSSFRYFKRIRESTVPLEKALGMLFGTMEIGSSDGFQIITWVKLWNVSIPAYVR